MPARSPYERSLKHDHLSGAKDYFNAQALAGARPMLWGEALTARGALDVRSKQAAYDLSYAYLDAGPAAVAELEAELWGDVTALTAGEPLPDALALVVFAWKNAALMARRREDDELPPTCHHPAQAEQRRRFRRGGGSEHVEIDRTARAERAKRDRTGYAALQPDRGGVARFAWRLRSPEKPVPTA